MATLLKVRRANGDFRMVSNVCATLTTSFNFLYAYYCWLLDKVSCLFFLEIFDSNFALSLFVSVSVLYMAKLWMGISNRHLLWEISTIYTQVSISDLIYLICLLLWAFFALFLLLLFFENSSSWVITYQLFVLASWYKDTVSWHQTLYSTANK